MAKSYDLRGGLMPATADGSVQAAKLESSYEPKNQLQNDLRAAWPKSSLILLTGESGTGKTSGAIGEAIRDLFAERVRKIIVTRPPVPNGPSIGFLTGDLVEKMLPWLSSVGDAMEGFTNATFAKLGVKLEVADLGLIQGRTVRDAVLIVDEASNIHDRQQLMCLATRVGRNGKVVLCGDPAQANLGRRTNPFAEFARDHAGTPGVCVLTATRADQLRSGFVKVILEAEEAIQARRRRK